MSKQSKQTKRVLNVQKISFDELLEKWGTCAYIGFRRGQELFIRSNAKGLINWDKAPVYTAKEIRSVRRKRRVCYTVHPEVFELP